MKSAIFWICLLCLATLHSSAFPLFDSISLSDYESTTHSGHSHHHHKHHIRRKHRRRSLSSKEEPTKQHRNKQIMLTKPYWPWP
ncbi:unnamed protein product [Caenorhabditis auriculariae]|uniref:Uncharacterized protein n=1 Tax=Caenorhabditis auriculariae TaxID=2777116 RepID=A0A8S1GU45_9PELO|nr:unnamed protein product [Caenorhabditis auriculariae]